MKRIILIASAMLLLGAGCIQVTGTNKGGNDGGLWASADAGVTWTQKSAINTVGAPKAFSGSNVTAVVFDPSDAKAVYVGTDDRGLVYSYDGANSWNEATVSGVTRVNAVAVNPADKCTVYVSSGNRIARTRDCLRTWTTTYVDTRGEASVTNLVVDFFNPAIVWASTSVGDLLKSTDNGSSWSVIKRFDGSVRQVLMTSNDSRVIWVSVDGKAIWKTADSGASWTDLTAPLKAFDGVYDTTTLAEDRATPGAMLIASRYGLVRSVDGGATWKSIPLLTPTGSTTIFSLTVHPKNSKEIWYGTGNTLYHSVDGGSKWTTKRLSTTRAATTLTINPANPGVLYLGATLFQQKKLF